MQVTVRCFSTVRERLGGDRFTLDLRASATLRDVVTALAARSADAAPLVDWLESGHLQLARNLEHAPPETHLSDGDEVALFPPVTGG